MIVQDGRNTYRLSIALPEKPRGLYEEFGDMLLDVLAGSEYETTLVQDGDTAVLESDILLMMGDCLSFERYADFFSKHTAKRPATIFWMLDSFPPTALDRNTAKVASRLRLYEQSLLWVRTHMKPVISIIPLSIRQKLGLKACSSLLHEFNSEDMNLHPSVRELDVNSWYEVFGRYEWFSRNIPKGWIDHIVLNTVPKAEFMRSMEAEFDLIPVGYHPIMGVDMGRERDIDVLMVGELDYGRRRDIVEAIERRLQPMEIAVTVVSGSCYGQKRTELFNRAKISLNIPRFQWDIPTIRFFISMACGTMAVSEEMGSTWPFENGKHLVQASAADLPDTIAYYLEHEHERRAITQAAQELITGELTLTNAANQVLALCRDPQAIRAA